MNKKEVISKIITLSTSEGKTRQEYFGIKNTENYGLTMPQLRTIAKQIGINQKLAEELWSTGIHEAKHIAVFISDPEKISDEGMEKWLKDFNSWDIVDNCCGTLFRKSSHAYKKAVEWSKREKEFEKRAGFSMMAMLAVHDKNAENRKFELFFPHIINASEDSRNFVYKAVNWALRQIGKRNIRLCHHAIEFSEIIRQKDDATSKWIASGALRELRKYLADGRIKNVGNV